MRFIKQTPHALTLLCLMLILIALSACEPPAPQVANQADESAAADAPETVTVTHPQGETTVVKNPQTVVVLNYSGLDTLDQLGIPVAGLPQGPLIPPFLEKYNGEEYTNIGSMREPDYEKINDLKPDLIIVGLRTAPLYEEMSKIAPTLDITVDWANKQETFNDYVTNLGLIFDKEDEVAERLEGINQKIETVRQTAEASGKTGLVVMASGGEVSGYGPGSRFGLVHDMLGIIPSDASLAAETHGDAISFEFILEQNPDIIYVIDRDSAIGDEGQSAEAVMDNELVAATTAGSEGNIVYVSSVNWYLLDAGLSTFAAMIDEVASGLE